MRSRPPEQCGWGAVRVRPVGESCPPVRKRYQYVRSGRSPRTSTWTLCPSSGRAWATPRRTGLRNRSSSAISHSTETTRSGMPPPCSGSGARRVHSTMPSGSGSPEATPRLNTPVGQRFGGPGGGRQPELGGSRGSERRRRRRSESGVGRAKIDSGHPRTPLPRWPLGPSEAHAPWAGPGCNCELSRAWTNRRRTEDPLRGTGERALAATGLVVDQELNPEPSFAFAATVPRVPAPKVNEPVGVIPADVELNAHTDPAFAFSRCADDEFRAAVAVAV